jgi:hypothetical protein
MPVFRSPVKNNDGVDAEPAARPTLKLPANFADVIEPSAGTLVFNASPIKMAKKLNPDAGAVVNMMVLVLTV